MTCEGDAGMDRATVRFLVKETSASDSYIYNQGVYLVATNNNCWECEQKYVLGQFTEGESQCANLLTSYWWTFALQDAATGVNYASNNVLLGENGIYNFTAILNGDNLNSDTVLDIQVEQNPDNAYIALAVWLTLIVIAAIFSMLYPYIASAWSPKLPFLESEPLVPSTSDNENTGIYSSSKKKVAFQDNTNASVANSPRTPASVAGSESNGGIWINRRSIDGGQSSVLSTPLMEDVDVVGGDQMGFPCFERQSPNPFLGHPVVAKIVILILIAVAVPWRFQ